jgi:uncharacterized protein (TIGR03382 family)
MVLARWVLITAALPIGYATAGALNAWAALGRRRRNAGAAEARSEAEPVRDETAAARDIP